MTDWLTRLLEAAQQKEIETSSATEVLEDALSSIPSVAAAATMAGHVAGEEVPKGWSTAADTDAVGASTVGQEAETSWAETANAALSQSLWQSHLSADSETTSSAGGLYRQLTGTLPTQRVLPVAQTRTEPTVVTTAVDVTGLDRLLERDARRFDHNFTLY